MTVWKNKTLNVTLKRQSSIKGEPFNRKKILKNKRERESDLINHELQLALLLSNEPSIEDLIDRPMAVTNDTLHVFILMKLKEVSLTFAKTLKKTTHFPMPKQGVFV